MDPNKAPAEAESGVRVHDTSSAARFMTCAIESGRVPIHEILGPVIQWCIDGAHLQPTLGYMNSNHSTIIREGFMIVKQSSLGVDIKASAH